MALTEAQRKANEKYIAANYSAVTCRWPREFCEQVRAAAEGSGQSLAGYVRQALEERMSREGTKSDE